MRSIRSNGFERRSGVVGGERDDSVRDRDNCTMKLKIVSGEFEFNKKDNYTPPSRPLLIHEGREIVPVDRCKKKVDQK